MSLIFLYCDSVEFSGSNSELAISDGPASLCTYSVCESIKSKGTQRGGKRPVAALWEAIVSYHGLFLCDMVQSNSNIIKNQAPQTVPVPLLRVLRLMSSVPRPLCWEQALFRWLKWLNWTLTLLSKESLKKTIKLNEVVTFRLALRPLWTSAFQPIMEMPKFGKSFVALNFEKQQSCENLFL